MKYLQLIAKLIIVIAGLTAIYLVLSKTISSANQATAEIRNNNANATISQSYVSSTPFGPKEESFKPGTTLFYNMLIQRREGQPCYVNTSWRWILQLPEGRLVMWNTDDGEFFAGDKTEALAQTTQIPETLLPGKYTLSRLSVFKCGDQTEYARTVRNIDLMIAK